MMGAGSADEVPAGSRETPANCSRHALQSASKSEAARATNRPLKRSFPALRSGHKTGASPQAHARRPKTGAATRYEAPRKLKFPRSESGPKTEAARATNRLAN